MEGERLGSELTELPVSGQSIPARDAVRAGYLRCRSKWGTEINLPKVAEGRPTGQSTVNAIKRTLSKPMLCTIQEKDCPPKSIGPLLISQKGVGVGVGVSVGVFVGVGVSVSVGVAEPVGV
jgi:hypothetical protein